MIIELGESYPYEYYEQTLGSKLNNPNVPEGTKRKIREALEKIKNEHLFSSESQS